MKVAQRCRVKTEAGVLRNVSARTERPALARDEHTARIGRALHVFKHRTQLPPHGPRHGVQPPGVAQGDMHHPALTGIHQHFTRHPGIHFLHIPPTTFSPRDAIASTTVELALPDHEAQP